MAKQPPFTESRHTKRHAPMLACVAVLFHRNIAHSKSDDSSSVSQQSRGHSSPLLQLLASPPNAPPHAMSLDRSTLSARLIASHLTHHCITFITQST